MRIRSLCFLSLALTCCDCDDAGLVKVAANEPATPEPTAPTPVDPPMMDAGSPPDGATTPALCLRPELVDFGPVAIGGALEREVEVVACGGEAIELADAWIDGTAELELVGLSGAPIHIEPGAPLRLKVRYAPLDTSADQARLVAHSAIGDAFVALLGRGRGCDIGVTPRSLSFGATGRQGRTLNVLVENTGLTSCDLIAVSLAPNSSSDFSLGAGSAPHAIAPGASTLVEVRYEPSSAGNDSGRLYLDSSDPDAPRVEVVLDGRRLGAGECELEVRPSALQFGVVPLGIVRSLSADVVNTGQSLCSVFSVALAQSSALEFQLVPPALPWLIAAGQSRPIEVRFRPLSAAPATGTLEIRSGLVPTGPPTVSVPLSGSGSGPRLCPSPPALVIGTQPLGGPPALRTVSLDSCGTEALVISALAFEPNSSPELSLSPPPALPLVIAPGSGAPTAVRYAGVDEGRDDGILRVESNDAIAPVQHVPIVAASSATPCGDLTGNVCDLSGSGPAAGAVVYVDTPAGRITTTTDTHGDFVLTCVPAGAHQVVARTGSWTTRFAATAIAGQVVAIPGSHCLDPESADVAVIEGDWDRVQDTLAGLGISYAMYGPDPRLFLEDAGELAQFDIVVFNCGFHDSVGLTQAALANLRSFVANGGSIYASDWAYDAIERAWPPFIDFAGDDGFLDNAQGGSSFEGMADVLEPTLVTALGGNAQVRISITTSAAGVDGVATGTAVYLSADRYADGLLRPTLVGFSPAPGAGRVFYSDFHNDGQLHSAALFTWLIGQL